VGTEAGRDEPREEEEQGTEEHYGQANGGRMDPNCSVIGLGTEAQKEKRDDDEGGPRQIAEKQRFFEKETGE
jgi:hypothetical protein